MTDQKYTQLESRIVMLEKMLGIARSSGSVARKKAETNQKLMNSKMEALLNRKIRS